MGFNPPKKIEKMIDVGFSYDFSETLGITFKGLESLVLGERLFV